MNIAKRVVTAVAVALTLGVATSQAGAAPIVWTDWTRAVVGTPGIAVGTMDGVTVTYTGQVSVPTQTGAGINYWNPDTPYLSATVGNAPQCCDIIALTGGVGSGISTLTFSSPVTNPIMAIVSLGQPNVIVDYDFDAPFNVLSSGAGYWGGPGTLTALPGDVLRGVEGHGAIQFLGTFNSISWTTTPGEYWHGFTVGTVPEPGTLGLLALAALGVARRVRRARRNGQYSMGNGQ